MHVAAAVGTPVVALYGSQNAALFRPVGANHRLLVPSMPCTPCLALNACVPGDSYRTYCVRRHTVDEVFAAVRSALAG
jgi:ADP-heptose:LPS heptosyltransferase